MTRATTVKWLALVVVAVSLCLLVVWNYSVIRNRDHACQCNNNLRQIGWALNNYHNFHGCFPATYREDAKSLPHSWRVRILPYLVQNQIFDGYRFDEPWNSDHNISVATKPPRKAPDVPVVGPPHCLFCPLDFGRCYEEGLTSYAMLVGPGTAFPIGPEREDADFPDGVANTIIVAEIDHERMFWLEPGDLHIERMSFRIHDPLQPSISSGHPQGPAVLFADGEVYRVSIECPPSIVKALITVDGGENICREDLIKGGQLLRAPDRN